MMNQRPATVDRGGKKATSVPSAETAVSSASDGPRGIVRWPRPLLSRRRVGVVVYVLGSLGLGFLASPARRRRRRRSVGISPLELFLAPLAFLSGVIGELVEVVLPLWSFFSGGLRRRLVVR